MALGAKLTAIVSMIIRQGMALVSVGLAISLACYIPASSAARADPTIALKYE